MSGNTPDVNTLGRMIRMPESTQDDPEYTMSYCEITIYYKAITDKYLPENLANVWRNTLTHELGHAMGLDDLDSGQSTTPSVPYSVMSYGRNRTLLSIPHNCDVAGVKKNYMIGG